MLKIAVLGIGNAGGQVANVANSRGFNAFCINSSEKDLDIINENIPVFLLGNSEGAGKDLELLNHLSSCSIRICLKLKHLIPL